MAEPKLQAQMYHAILVSFVQTGRAPHYAELARSLDLRPEDSRRILHEIVDMRLPNWLVPDTDDIASFAPFSNVPNNYRISVDGEQRWYAQCGLEALAVSWLFPGREIRVDSACLDCAEPVGIHMRDGKLLSVEPRTVVGHVNLPVRRWRENYAFA
jgi:hypothetical protein